MLNVAVRADDHLAGNSNAERWKAVAIGIQPGRKSNSLIGNQMSKEAIAELYPERMTQTDVDLICNLVAAGEFAETKLFADWLDSVFMQESARRSAGLPAQKRYFPLPVDMSAPEAADFLKGLWTLYRSEHVSAPLKSFFLQSLDHIVLYSAAVLSLVKEEPR